MPARMFVALLAIHGIVVPGEAAQASAQAEAECAQVFEADPKTLEECVQSIRIGFDEGATLGQGSGNAAGLTMSVAVPTDFDCSLDMKANARYWKARGDTVVKQEGKATTTSNCRADALPIMKVSARIDDFGAPGIGSQKSAADSGQGAGPGPVVASVFQQVLIIQGIPPDYHGIGSRIEWTFRVHAVFVDGQESQACAKARAYFPLKPERVGC